MNQTLKSRKLLMAAHQNIKEKEYWWKQLSGELVKSFFPYDHKKPASQRQIDEVKFRFSRELNSRLAALSKNSDPKLHVIMTAALGVLVSKYTGNEDILIGTPIYKQNTDAEFINTILVLRNRIPGQTSFKELILNTREVILAAVENRNYPVEILCRQLDMPYDRQEDFPLFDVSLVMENIQDKSYMQDINCNMIFSIKRTGQEIDGTVEYRSTLYRKTTIDRIIRHFIHLLEEVVRNIEIKLQDIGIQTPEDRRRLLFEFNNTKKSLPAAGSYHELFQEVVTREPGKIAAVHNHRHISYDKLDRETHRIAGILRGYGVNTDTFVALYLKRSIEMLAAIIGVFKAGGAYLPMEMEWPITRLAYILENSEPRVVVTETHHLEILHQAQALPHGFENILCLDDKGEHKTGPGTPTQASPGKHPGKNNTGDNLAYMIYTSGTTGKPKGVLIHQKGMINHLYAKIDELSITAKDVIAQTASAGFDISVWQFLAGLLPAGKVLIIDTELLLEFRRFLQVLQREKVTIIELVPSLIEAFLESTAYGDEKTFRYLKWMILTGEPLGVPIARKWKQRYPAVTLVNAYGPTEASDDITHYFVEELPPPDQTTIPIGRPLQNLHVYILDRNLALCPIGVRGEICVAGIGVGKGYWKDREKTGEAFIPNPFLEEIGDNDFALLYKTGDVGYSREDGNIECLGRLDYQVKIRGNRIELGEIENQLLGHEQVKQAVVIVTGEENKELCAYVTAEPGKELDIKDLKNYLSERLPEYMIPAHFMQIDRMPLTPNGKIDRKKLPTPGVKTGEPGETFVPPQDKIQHKLTQIWSEILDIEREKIGIDDNFFDLGGHSLRATVLVSRIHRELNVKLQLLEIFKTQTIRKLSGSIKGAAKDRYASIENAEKKEYYLLSSAQKRLYFLQEMYKENTAYNLPQAVLLQGETREEKLEQIFINLIRRHESLRTSFEMIGKEPIQRIHEAVEFRVENHQVEVEVEEGQFSHSEGTRGLTPLSKPADGGPRTAEDIIRLFIRPFDLSGSPLVRAGLIKQGEQKNILIVDMHHIISDGVSYNVLIRDFITMYKGEEQPALRLQYKDFSEWQHTARQQEAIEKQKEYWLKEFSGEIPVLNMPLDHQRPMVQDFTGSTIIFDIDGEAAGGLRTLAIKEGTTFYTLLAAIFNVLMQKLTGQEDIIIGTPTAGRRHAESEQIIGDFVNTLALRNYPEREKRFIDFLYQVKENVLEAFENQDYPFEELVNHLEVNRDISRNPLFDVLLVLQNLETPTADMPGLKVKPYDYVTGYSKFDLTLQVIEIKDQLSFSMEYCTKLFEKTAIQRFIAYLKKIITTVLADNKQKIYEIEIIPGDEKQQVLFEFNQTRAEYPRDKTLRQLFVGQAGQTPDRIALKGNRLKTNEEVTLSYRALKETSARWGGLLKKRGLQPGHIAAVMVERSIEMMVGIFSILEAGGAYLPVDPEYPAERIDYMLADSGARWLLTAGDTKSVGSDFIDRIDMSPMTIISSASNTYNASDMSDISGSSGPLSESAASLAYVIYTSGSTGKPKGVMIRNTSAVNRLNWMQRCYPLDAADVILQKTPITFDVSVWELFWWSFYGAGLYLLQPAGEKDPEAIIAAIEKKKVTTMHFVPSMLNAFLEYLESTLGEAQNAHRLTGLKQVFASGEALETHHVIRFNRLLHRTNRTKLVNLYGPTEATVDVSYFNCTGGIEENHPVTIPIGKPIDNIRLYVLGHHLQPQPVGIPGELCISGVGLAMGYLNRPGLTAEKFDRDLYKKFLRGGPGGAVFSKRVPPGRRRQGLYRTGDLARWRPDGNIEFLGRIDHQVKIRGYRIEPGEIQRHLAQHPRIKDTLVMAREDKNRHKYLCAYIIPAASPGEPETPGSETDNNGLRDFLGRSLPTYMIPSYFVTIAEFPLTPNGKIDRKALPDPSTLTRSRDVYTPPANQIQEKLAALWTEVLENPHIDIRDNFFNTGGDSIKTIRLIDLINSRFQANFRIVDIYIHETIETFSLLIERSGNAPALVDRYYDEALEETEELKKRIMPIIEANGTPGKNIEDVYPMSDIEKGMIFYSLKQEQDSVYHDQFVYQSSYPGFDRERLKQALELLTAKHSILRTVFDVDNYGEPVQLVYKNIEIDFTYYDIRDQSKADQEKFIVEIMGKDRQNPFSIGTPPLWRMMFFFLGGERYCAVFAFHHAILDGWSNASFITELNNLYIKLKSTPGFDPGKLKLTYKDYIIDQLAEKKKPEVIEYWKVELSGYKRLVIPTAESMQPKGKSDPGITQELKRKIYRFDMGADFLGKLQISARENNTGIKHLLFASYVYMLSMFSYDNELLVGLVGNGRLERTDGDKVLGCFLNTIPVRVTIPAGLTWENYLRLVDNKVRELKKYERLSFFEILRIIGEKPGQENPLFDTIFSYVDFHVYNQAELEDGVGENRGYDSNLDLKGYENTNTLLDIITSTTSGNLEIWINYSGRYYSAEFVETLGQYLKNILEQMVNNPQGLVSKNNFLSPREKQQLLEELITSGPGYPVDKTLHRLFREQAERNPHVPALRGIKAVGAESLSYLVKASLQQPTDRNPLMELTYRQLDEESDHLARQLQAVGVTPGKVVGIMVKPCLEMIIGIMGILKAGAAYLPINPGNPDERTRYMLEDSAAHVLLTTETACPFSLRERIDAGKKILYMENVLSVDKENPSRTNPDPVLAGRHNNLDNDITSLAYIIYTSGSTGKPKGVPIPHINVSSLMYWGYKHMGIDTADRTLHTLSYSFDFSVWEIFITITSGASLYLIGEEVLLDPELMINFMEQHKITVLHITPTHCYYLVNREKPSTTLRYLFYGGEKVTPELVTKSIKVIPNDCRIINTYGPTETTIFCSILEIDREAVETYKKLPCVSIGKPHANFYFIVVDRSLDLCPIGVTGELLIGGIGVAPGYLNNPELTAEKFCLRQPGDSFRENLYRYPAPRGLDPRNNFSLRQPGTLHSPHSPLTTHHSPIYKTGDLVRLPPDGNFEFISRIDQQVKIRGYRIELGEIESHILSHPGIKEAVVMIREDVTGDKYLCSYLVGDNKLDTAVIREYLSKRLPDYMIPAYFRFLERMPLTPNKKVDLKALPQPEREIDEEDIVAPRDKTEQQLLQIWSQILGLDSDMISIYDNFFELGGHSLKAVELVNKIHKHMNVKMPLVRVFELVTIEMQAMNIHGRIRDIYSPIRPVEKKDWYQVTAAQRRMYFVELVTRDLNYNVPQFLVLEGDVNRQRLEQSLRELIGRHECFRTTFDIYNDRLVQRVHDRAAFEAEYFEEKEENVPSILRGFIRLFNFTTAPLMRAGLIKITGKRYIFMMDIHHIIVDLLAYDILVKEFGSLYMNKELPQLKIHYKDYSEWQNSSEQKEAIKKQEEFWLNNLSGELPLLNLPLDFPRPAVQNFEGDRIEFKLSIRESQQLKRILLKENVTLFIALLSIYNLLLSAITGQDDILVGIFFLNHRHEDLRQVIGMFVNLLVCRNFIDKEDTYFQFLDKVKRRTLDNFENQQYDFDELVDKLGIERDISRYPLCDAMFEMEKFDVSSTVEVASGITDFNIRPYIYDFMLTKFDLGLFCTEMEDYVNLTFRYCKKLFMRKTIERFIVYFRRILTAVLENPGIKLSAIEILSGDEKKQLIDKFNDTGTDYPAAKTIHQLFAQQVRITPDVIAASAPCSGTAASSLTARQVRYLSYKELSREVERLAAYLHFKGVKAEQAVGLMAEPSLEVIVGLLAILEVGGVYLPVNPGYPGERKAYLLEDGQVKLVLSNCPESGIGDYDAEVLHLGGPGIYSHDLNENYHPHTRFNNPAYIIYTSGSTGRPKGVIVEHRNVVRLVKNTDYIRFNEKDRILQTGALEFDASTFEIWGALLNGLAIYLTGKETILNPESFKHFLLYHDIGTIWLTAPLFNRLVDADVEIFQSLDNLLVGGDVLSPHHINRVKQKYPHLNITNGYGPTENTTFSTTFRVEKQYDGNIPIGRPIANSTAYIIDKTKRLVPIGVTGELVVGGDGVARGYLNQPELTAEKFVIRHLSLVSKKLKRDVIGHSSFVIGKSKSTINRNSTNDRLYKTGDLCRWLADGNIEFTGRIDNQVKIRGFRIEPGEIERHLLTYDNIKEAVVIIRESRPGTGPANIKDDKYICAYIVPMVPGKVPDEKEIRHYLTRYLPDYMIPSYFMELDRVPLTPNGKIDKKALPETITDVKEKKGYIAPMDQVERQMVAIWAEILGIAPDIISIDSNFFHLGGHSLKVTVLVSRIHRVFNVKIPLVEVFKKPYIDRLAIYIKQALPEYFESIIPVEKKEYYPLSSAQKRMYILQQMELSATVYNIFNAFVVKGEINLEKLSGTFKRLIQRHESLRTLFAMQAGEPVQVVLDEVEFEIALLENGQGRGEVSSPVEIGTITRDFIRPFDLTRAPLLRVGLMKLPHTLPALGGHPRRGTYKSQEGKENKYLLMVDMHHIISDGVSQIILMADFLSIYKEETLPPLRIQYQDYACWQTGEIEKNRMKKQQRYWMNEFSNPIPVIQLPLDYPRPVIQSFEGAVDTFEIPAREKTALEQLALEQGVTLYMVLLSIFSILLSKLSGQEDMVLGTPIAGRRHSDIQEIIGMFVNTLALRIYPQGDKTFIRFLQEVKEKTVNAFENQEYQFEDLVEDLTITRDAGRNPLFDIMFALQNIAGVRSRGIGTETTGQQAIHFEPFEIESETPTSKFDLVFYAIEGKNELNVRVEYCTKLFKPAAIQRMIDYFRTLVEVIKTSPRQPISGIEIISAREKKQVLYEFNDQGVTYTRHTTIPQLFSRQVEKNPGCIAVVGYRPIPYAPPGTPMEIHLSYGELQRKSRQLARYLTTTGSAPHRLVGIMVEPSLEMLTGIIGILNAGSGYVPLDPKAPRERKKYILAECQVPILLTQPHLQGEAEFFNHCLDLEDAGIYPPLPVEESPGTGEPGDWAYVIFTSGSTGIPKGVPISHANLSPLLHWGYRHLGLDSFHRTMQNLSYYFDWSVWEIMITLTTGASLYSVPAGMLPNPEAYTGFMQEKGITVLHATPTQFSYLVDVKPGPMYLQYLFIGAEKLTLDLVRRSFYWVSGCCRVFNMYGPTEAAIISAVLEIDREAGKIYENLTGIPIGKPAGNTHLLVLDEYLKPCPINTVGELYIAGHGLSVGYLNDPGKTGGNFIENHYQTGGIIGARLYKTGDRCRWLADGNMEFLGRKDHQVKIRGYRIELGEIESRLSTHPRVKETVVLARENQFHETYLCAYIVNAPDHPPVPPGTLKEHLAETLPEYMIPAYFVVIDKIPLNPNGKVDRSALPMPGIDAGKIYAAPRDRIEEKLADLWAEVLGIEPAHPVGIDDNFFESGGHSLKATVLVSRVHKAFEVKLPLVEVFAAPSIRGLAGYIRKAAGEKYAAIWPTEKKDYYKLSSAQKRLYILNRMVPAGTVYNMPEIIPLDWVPDLELLKETFQRLIARHESLGTSFHQVGEEPVQVVHDKVEFEIENYQVEDTEETLTKVFGSPEPFFQKGFWPPEAIIRNFIRPFDLSRAPLLRVGLLELPHTPSVLGGHPRRGTNNSQKGNEDKYLLLLDMHHIISDGMSRRVLGQEFLALERGDTLEPLRLQYKDFTAWQHSEEQKTSIKQQEQYWLNEFAGEIPVLDMPLDYPRPAVQVFEGRTIRYDPDRETATNLNRMAATTGVTLYMLLLAVCNVLLAKLSGQEDIVIGSPIAGRRHADLEKIIGMFVNTLALRNYPQSEKSFQQFLREVKERTLKSFENQEYQFEDLVELAGVRRDTGRNPLFDVMFNLNNIMEAPGSEGTGQSSARAPQANDYEDNMAKFDLTITAVESPGQLTVFFQYCTRLFKESTIRRYQEYFKQIIAYLPGNMNKPIKEIQMLPEEEKKTLLHVFNDTGSLYPHEKTLVQLFIGQAGKTPDNIAVFAPVPGQPNRWQYISYRELDKKTGQLARYLHHQGAGKNDFVGLKVNRSREMIIGILGILKAGSAYVPLDPGAPEVRQQYILEECRVKILLTGTELEMENYIGISGRTRKTIPGAVDSEDFAYVIFTSGSTGTPKGVPITHANLSPLLHWGYRHLGIGAFDRTLQDLAYYFDWSVWEIFITLTTGAGLYIAPEEILLDPPQSIAYMQQHRITVLHATPTRYSYIANVGIPLESLNYLFIGAEKLTLDLLERGLETTKKDCRVFNMYGPTECTIISAVLEIHRAKPQDSLNAHLTSIPIGVPVGNTSLLVLDRNLELTPINTAGELYIGGEGVAAGYLNDPGKSARAFLDNPYKNQGIKGPRIYKTGDWTRWLENGTVEFLGRIDHQVKIRGYRIELGEIENRLLSHPAVKEAVVLNFSGETGKNPQEQYLCAYIVPAAKETVDLKKYLSGFLPDYMIPPVFMEIDHIPLNPNGKIDRKALPLPVPKGEKTRIAPRDKMEEQLAAIWAEVLGIEPAHPVGIDDNFFEWGGHSLKATVLVSRVYKVFNIKLPLVEIFTSPTIRQLAQYIKDTGRGQLPLDDPNLVLLRQGSHQAGHIFFIHDGSGEVEGYVELCRHPDIAFNCWGIRANRLQNYTPANLTIRELAEEYIRRLQGIQPHGPYYIAGWSLGGTIAYEIVRQLEQQGETIDFFSIIDSPPPGRETAGQILPFTLESESDFIRRYLPGINIDTSQESLAGPDALWAYVLEALSKSANNLEALRSLFPGQMAQIIPNFRQQDLQGLVYYLNVTRSLARARSMYQPAGKINTPMYYFAASQSIEVEKEHWNDYCNQPVTYYQVEGTHTSIMRKPAVEKLAHYFSMKSFCGGQTINKSVSPGGQRQES